MQIDNTPPPKIRHKDSRKDRAIVRMVTTPFMKKLVKEFGRQVEEVGGGRLTGEVSDHLLLTNRKCLVSLVKNGMYERKDLEVEIATQAMMVWWLRLGKEDREAMMDAAVWGRNSNG